MQIKLLQILQVLKIIGQRQRPLIPDLIFAEIQDLQILAVPEALNEVLNTGVPELALLEDQGLEPVLADAKLESEILNRLHSYAIFG